MDPETFLTEVERLTGSKPKEIRGDDRNYLAEGLRDSNRIVDASQFNEFLLIANKDRVSRAFFQYFFCAADDSVGRCAIKDIPVGIDRFQKVGMLCFGNFVYAYRQLSRAPTRDSLVEQLGRHGRTTAELLDHFRNRSPPVLTISAIARAETYLVGYLSAGEIVADRLRGQRLRSILQRVDNYTTWEDLDAAIRKDVADPTQARAIAKLARALIGTSDRSQGPTAIIPALSEGLTELDALNVRLNDVRKTGARNSDVYLTWDHMDIYFATSMRKKWEYEDLYEFVTDLTALPDLTGLNVRWFDPTQSFDRNRINKGLIESLMLKRAVCTVYSSQDTDTLGKDSELAATLAQGKPVIAYAPTIDIDQRTRQLVTQRPQVLKERLQFVSYADSAFAETVASEVEFLQRIVQAIDRFEESAPWRAITDRARLAEFQAAYSDELERLGRILASAEQRVYNKRAKTLQDDHPLGIQVNLDTGVANGVLVVRDVKTCGELVRRILLNTMRFDVKDDGDTESWLLREQLTGSVYRVVTRNRKLTNCFWNFYRQDLGKDGTDGTRA